MRLNRRLVLVLCLLIPIAIQGKQAPEPARRSPQGAGGANPSVPRAIRRDVPLTNSIRRAYEAGTRDLTGRPGPNYWQLQADYSIDAKLDPATDTITGSETITLHTNAPRELPEIALPPDQNISRGLVQRATTPAENPAGMVVTSLSVDGASIDPGGAPPA